MEYPKPVMTKRELEIMGFQTSWLLKAYRTQGTRAIAWKASNAENSKLMFDTEALEKYRKSQCV